MTDRPPVHASKRWAAWLWTGGWILAIFVAALWVFRPDPAYQPPEGWTYWNDPGPVMEVLPNAKGFLAVGREGVLQLGFDGKSTVVELPAFEGPPVTYSLAQDSQSRFWLGHAYGLSIGAPGDWAYVRELADTAINEVRAIEIDARGRAWIGSDSGVWRIDQAEDYTGNNDVQSATRLLDGVRVMVLLADRYGDVWAGTTDGLYHWSDQTQDWRTWGRADGLPNQQVSALLEDTSGRIWVGTGFHDKGGSVIFSRRSQDTWEIEKAIPTALMPAAKARSFFQDRHGNVWIGTETNGFSVITGDFELLSMTQSAALPSLEITAIGQLPNGAVWLGTLNGLLLLSKPVVDKLNMTQG